MSTIDIPTALGAQQQARLTALEGRAVVHAAGLFVPASSGAPWPGRATSAVVDGDSPGTLAVPGIKTSDRLQGVIDLASPAANLTDEFTIPADGEIDNTGGTDTTGDRLLVQWAGGYTLTGMAFDPDEDEKTGCTLWAPLDFGVPRVFMLVLAETFEEGTCRWFCNDDLGTGTDVALPGGAISEMTGWYSSLVWTPITGIDQQVCFMSFGRDADHVNDDLPEDAAVIALLVLEEEVEV
jgi:hypothetical protein